ncbi:hypothetical protein K469DRAFT_753391 [Zopfia rhizophila CBS 207.26]|uniref:C2H2-type domain-containing protein n=1 Tax=Zopfia rhizophila CBS 207.26 TaxID=1314779 RepID=A0A6A6DN20_9PEZI|nr:hypothetical protein K469DRAFT_753391 [Zopfia rhizophila CBS 207.26]
MYYGDICTSPDQFNVWEAVPVTTDVPRLLKSPMAVDLASRWTQYDIDNSISITEGACAAVSLPVNWFSSPIQATTTALEQEGRRHGIEIPRESSPMDIRLGVVPQDYRSGTNESTTSLANSDSVRHPLQPRARPHKCIVQGCSSAFRYRKDLRRHERGRHRALRLASGSVGEEEELFYCPVGGCDYSLRGFTRKDNCRRHIRNVHGIMSESWKLQL